MGFKLVREINERDLPRNEKTVWKALADHARDADCAGAYPSQETLARETGYTDRQVRTLLRRLERRGAIMEARKPSRRTTREYLIVLDAVPVDSRWLRPEETSALRSRPEVCDIKTGRNFRQTLRRTLRKPARARVKDY